MTEGISALGTYGLGGTGFYGTYDPTMIGMMGSYGSGMMNPMMMNPMMMGGYGMGMGAMGMGSSYMDQYMDSLKKYNEYMEKMEERKVEHAIQMHKKEQMAEVANLSAHDQAFFMKAVEDGDVQHGIREIHDAIRKKNLSYAAQKFFELKQEIYNKFSEYFKTTEGNINTDEKIKQYICILYSEIAGGYASSNGVKPDLKNDIEKYGENSFENAFNSHWFGNKDHNQLTSEQALYQMFGTGEQDIGTKKNMAMLGTATAAVGEALGAGVVGGAAGATIYGTCRAVLPNKLGFGNWGWEHNLAKKFNLKRLPGAMKWSAIAAGLVDIAWQLGRD